MSAFAFLAFLFAFLDQVIGRTLSPLNEVELSVITLEVNIFFPMVFED